MQYTVPVVVVVVEKSVAERARVERLEVEAERPRFVGLDADRVLEWEGEESSLATRIRTSI